jgi:hypothetical protein
VKSPTVISNVPGKTTYAGNRTPQWKIHISILQDFPGTKGYPKKKTGKHRAPFFIAQRVEG